MCNCWKKPTPSPIPLKKEILHNGATVQIKSMSNKSLPAPKDGDVTRFCKKCNWKINKIKYHDSVNNFMIEKYICSNQNCPLHT